MGDSIKGLTEAEAVINFRPLVYVGEDFDSGFSFTPDVKIGTFSWLESVAEFLELDLETS